MSLKRALDKIPENIRSKRRGRLIAIEGPICSESKKTVDKIIEELDDPVIIGADLSCLVDIPNEPNAFFLRLITRIREMQDMIVTALNQGKLVIVFDYILHAIVQGVLLGVNRTDQMQNVASARYLGRYLDGVIVPDRIFVFCPSVETYSSRVEKRFNVDQDIYMFSNHRKEVDHYMTFCDYLDRVSMFRGDPVSMESDLLNIIVMDSLTNGCEKIRFYYA